MSLHWSTGCHVVAIDRGTNFFSRRSISRGMLYPAGLSSTRSVTVFGSMQKGALNKPNCFQRLRQRAATFAALRQRELERHHALERQAARPYKDAVLLLDCDRMVGPWAIDRSPTASHPTRLGAAYCTIRARR